MNYLNKDLQERVREALPVSQLARLYGVKLRASNGKLRGPCPLCGGSDKATKFVIYEDDRRWHCFACDRGGDVFQLAQEQNPSQKFRATIVELAEFAGLDTTPTTSHKPTEQQGKPNVPAVWAALACDSEPGRAYLQSRGLTHWRAGGDVRFDDRQARLCVALRQLDGSLTNVVSRFYGCHQGAKVRGLTSCGTTGTFGDFRKLIETNGPVMVVEGITDWISARQLWPDRLVLGAHGAGRLPWLCQAIAPELAKRQRPVIIVPDRDQAGETAARKAIEEAVKAGLPRSAISVAILPDEGDDLNDLVTKHDGELSKLKLRPASGSIPGMMTPLEAVAEHNHLVKQPVIPTGFPLLDQTLGGGLRATQTYVLAAGTGQGKTSWVLQLATQHIANGGAAAFWTLEMPPSMLQARILAQKTGRSWLNFLGSEIDPNHPEIASLQAGLLYYKGVDAAEFARAAQQLPAGKRPLLIVDYIQKLSPSGMGLREAVTEASEHLRALAIRLTAPIVAVSSVSRDAAKRIRDQRNCHPRDLENVGKESGGIEYDAATLLVLGQDRNEDGTAVLSVAKNRFGLARQVELSFDGETGRFQEIGLVESNSNRKQRALRDSIRSAIEDSSQACSKRGIIQVVKGASNEAIAREVDAMLRDGELEKIAGGFVVAPDHD